MLGEAASRSSTLQALVDRLDQSDVIVYVEHAVLDSSLRARTRLVGARGGWRYVRVQIDCRQNLTSQVAFLGHELQHAVEIADATTTVDEPSLLQLYRKIGFALYGDESKFETDGAVDTGRQVQREWLASATVARRAANESRGE
jgi:hypothetical protein